MHPCARIKSRVIGRAAPSTLHARYRRPFSSAGRDRFHWRVLTPTALATSLRGPDLTRASFIAAGRALGSAFQDPLTLDGATNFPGTGPNDGPSRWQPFAYQDACACCRPAGPTQAIQRGG